MPQTNPNEWDRIDKWLDEYRLSSMEVPARRRFINKIVNLLSRHDKERTAEVVENVKKVFYKHWQSAELPAALVLNEVEKELITALRSPEGEDKGI